jgi:hypothetical protein
MTDLNKILEDSRPAIEAGLLDAQEELAALDDRRRHLESLIARARAALGEIDIVGPSDQVVRPKLHEAMELVLNESPNRSMRVQDLAKEINERGLYEKRDRSPVEPNQIHARASAKTYAHLFVKKDGVISLAVTPERTVGSRI